MKDLTPQIYQ